MDGQYYFWGLSKILRTTIQLNDVKMVCEKERTRVRST